MPNIEIKARYEDLDKARRIAKKHHTAYVGVLRQVDTYFKTRTGRLKLREIEGKSAQLIPYLKEYRTGPMRSDYAVLPVDEPALVKRLFGTLLGNEFVVDKVREVFLIDNVRVHLDQVKGLGSFVEFEAVCATGTDEERLKETEKVKLLMNVFEIREEDLLNLSYIDYLEHRSG